jgi:hypothetical protein
MMTPQILVGRAGDHGSQQELVSRRPRACRDRTGGGSSCSTQLSLSHRNGPAGNALLRPGRRSQLGAAGSTVRVWADAAGRLTGRPLQPLQVRDQAALAAIAAPVVVGMVLLWTGELAYYLLGRWRLAAWEADWLITAPQWARQR